MSQHSEYQCNAKCPRRNAVSDGSHVMKFIIIEKILKGKAPLHLSPPGRGRFAWGLGYFWGWRLTPLVIVRLALLTALRFLGRLAMPALLCILYILEGGISRLTRRIAPSHWSQPYPLPGGERQRGTVFVLLTLWSKNNFFMVILFPHLPLPLPPQQSIMFNL